MLDKFFRTIEKIVPAKYQWVLNHEGFKRYFANTGWMFLGQMFSLIVSFFIGAWIARYLGPENYGILSYVVAFVGLFGFIASLGIDGILNRELVKYPDNRDELISAAFYLKLFGGGMAFLLSFIFSFIFLDNFLLKILIAIFSLSYILQALDVIGIYFQSKVLSKYNFRAQLAATIISSLLKCLVILFDGGIIYLIIVLTIDSFWRGLFLLKEYRKVGFMIVCWKFKIPLFVKLLKSSLPLMFAVAASFIYTKVDQIMIGHILGNHSVGLYAAAVKLVDIWNFIPGIVCASLFPAVINSKKISFYLYNKRLKNLYFLMLALSLSVILIVTLFAKKIILLLFGPDYLDSVIILKVYIWSSIGTFMTIAMSQYFIIENLIKTMFFVNFLAMLFNILLNLIFIPSIGLTGAATATFLSSLLMPVIFFIFKKYYLLIKKI